MLVSLSNIIYIIRNCHNTYKMSNDDFNKLMLKETNATNINLGIRTDIILYYSPKFNVPNLHINKSILLLIKLY